MSEITVGEAHARWSAGELNIVDVREPNEHEATRVEGIPLIPMGEVIERIEVHVGEELAGLVADRNPTPPLARREQIVAWKPHEYGFLRIASVDDLAHKP